MEKSKPKPIFVCGLPKSTSRKAHEQILRHLHSELNEDYYVVCYVGKIDKHEFNCFCVDEIEVKRIEEIKEFIKNQKDESIKQTQGSDNQMD